MRYGKLVACRRWLLLCQGAIGLDCCGYISYLVRIRYSYGNKNWFKFVPYESIQC